MEGRTACAQHVDQRLALPPSPNAGGDERAVAMVEVGGASRSTRRLAFQTPDSADEAR